MHRHLETCLATVLSATKGAGDECNMRRDPAKWSVAEIVEHLSRAYSGTAKGFERCIEKGQPLASTTSARQWLSQFVVINLGMFPEGRQAPKHIIPTGEISLGAVLEATGKHLQWLDDAAIKTRGALGAGKMLDHPILGALTVDQWLAFHVAHTHHHAKQIRARR
jgi:Protein of unknown function (DUF1569)